jgi:hypothetical protein
LSSERTLAAIGSLEYSKWIVGEISRNCLNYATTLGVADAATSNVATQQEALLWSLLAWNLLEPDFQHHISRLAQAQLVLLSDDELKMSGAGSLVGRLIIQNIIIPYLDQR